MEKTLKTLFDYQKFDGNRELQAVIDAVHTKYAKKELSMDEMDMVFAAGTPELPRKQKDVDK